jgi:2-haloalkanoic acid dehalogenase type II
MTYHYDAVFFDLLSALLDSWSLWDDVAGSSSLGREWRLRYLEATCHTASYQPYLALVAESANAVGIAKTQADVLGNRWSELRPWPEAAAIIAEIASKTKIGVVSNCSEELGLEAVSRFGISFDVFLSAERAGYYKPDPRIYEKAIEEIGKPPERILYVAGSPYDVRGAAAAGMPVYWHNRIGLVDIGANSMAVESSETLLGLRRLIV